jgi:DNA-binding CsgD family transcriptional regulator
VNIDMNTATALLAALGLAREHGSAVTALEAAGIDLTEAERLQRPPGDFKALTGNDRSEEAASEMLALGFLAGRVAQRPRARARRILPDPTCFIMDRELVVQRAEGESILRLPWFDDGLFAGRQLPDISEIPTPIRTLAVENYRAALTGERRRYSFMSYGHAYSVDAVPVVGDDGRTEAVLAIAKPASAFAAAARAHERMAERMEDAAVLADQRADGHRLAGRSDDEAIERQVAARGRRSADQARDSAARLSARDTVGSSAGLPSPTSRETEVLTLASHGLTSEQIADLLAVSGATIKTHLRNIYGKLGVSDRAGAVAAALRHGFIE